MIAISLRDNKELTVFKYKNILYAETNSNSLPYRIFEQTSDKPNEIAYETNYSYYYIDNVLYDSYLSNVYKSFSTDTEQLTLFDRCVGI